MDEATLDEPFCDGSADILRRCVRWLSPSGVFDRTNQRAQLPGRIGGVHGAFKRTFLCLIPSDVRLNAHFALEPGGGMKYCRLAAAAELDRRQSTVCPIEPRPNDIGSHPTAATVRTIGLQFKAATGQQYADQFLLYRASQPARPLSNLTVAETVSIGTRFLAELSESGQTRCGAGAFRSETDYARPERGDGVASKVKVPDRGLASGRSAPRSV